ncbi:hypothetical protein HK18_06355 [Commensalibacter intestini]|uniref:Uncharacterized protein n=1 Tax=Commensalibacter intestini TaxID=479936 RepID=A0A251ZWG7_9PROT|nr:hypothetical protein [Commensalibacter intestini]OUI78999.1 hypothetical protein HK18_06355 [Commensalibacter intestini]
MVKKIIFVLIGCIACWWFFSPVSLQDQLYSSIKAKCKNQEKCIVHLHEITSFKWDKAYFFSPQSRFSINIDQVIGGATKEEQKGKRETLVVFTLNGKVVQEEIFDVIVDDDLRLPPLIQFSPHKSVDINFFLGKNELKNMNYSGDISDFYDLIYIEYYKMTPQNDQLNARCATIRFTLAAGSNIKEKQCWLSFANLSQIMFLNPKTYKN